MKKLLVVTLFSCLSAYAIVGGGGSTLSGKVNAKGVSVVYFDPIPGKTFAPTTQTLVINHTATEFQPHLTVVTVGTTVEFKNTGALAHDIYWPDVNGNKKLAHDLGSWAPGETREFRFDHPGIVQLACKMHPEMAGFILVSPTPYFAVTDSEGHYMISHIPDGMYTVSAWHEGSKVQVKLVTVAGDSQEDFSPTVR